MGDLATKNIIMIYLTKITIHNLIFLKYLKLTLNCLQYVTQGKFP